MKTGNIKAIIFDLGRVVVDFDHMSAARAIAPFTDKSAGEIYDLFFDSPLTGLFEEGKISAQDFFLRVKELLGLRLDYAGFVQAWNNIFFISAQNRAVYELAKSLKTGYPVGLLSNVNILHLEHLMKNFPVFDVFDHVIASCQVGSKKPDHAIYDKALEVLGVKPQEAFYTDDRPELVESARILGIQGFVFSGLEQLKGDLTRSGVSIGQAPFLLQHASEKNTP